MIPEFEHRRSALFFDVDGTLIDIAARPNEVVVPRALLDALERLSGILDGALALVSGRTIANIDHLFAPLMLRASGVHGAEFRLEPDAPIDAVDDVALPAAVIESVRQLSRDFPGTLVEDKRFSVAIHYRLAPAAAPKLREALDVIAAASGIDRLRILPGHMVFEVKRATFDKGLAIDRFMDRAPFTGRQPVFLGDDVTDRPGFDAVLRRGGLAFSVGPMIPGVTGAFADPAAVRTWVAHMAASETSHA